MIWLAHTKRSHCVWMTLCCVHQWMNQFIIHPHHLQDIYISIWIWAHHSNPTVSLPSVVLTFQRSNLTGSLKVYLTNLLLAMKNVGGRGSPKPHVTLYEKGQLEETFRSSALFESHICACPTLSYKALMGFGSIFRYFKANWRDIQVPNLRAQSPWDRKWAICLNDFHHNSFLGWLQCLNFHLLHSRMSNHYNLNDDYFIEIV